MEAWGRSIDSQAGANDITPRVSKDHFVPHSRAEVGCDKMDGHHEKMHLRDINPAISTRRRETPNAKKEKRIN